MVKAWLTELDEQIRMHTDMCNQCVGSLYRGILADQTAELVLLHEELLRVCEKLEIKVAT